MKYTDTPALAVHESGRLSRITAAIDANGAPVDSYGQRLAFRGSTTLEGWGELDGPAFRWGPRANCEVSLILPNFPPQEPNE